jgi:hypothetical protein
MSSSGQAPGNPFDPTRPILQAMSIEDHIALAEHQLKLAARDRRDRYIQAALTGLLVNADAHLGTVAHRAVAAADYAIAEADKESQP